MQNNPLVTRIFLLNCEIKRLSSLYNLFTLDGIIKKIKKLQISNSTIKANIYAYIAKEFVEGISVKFTKSNIGRKTYFFIYLLLLKCSSNVRQIQIKKPLQICKGFV